MKRPLLIKSMFLAAGIAALVVPSSRAAISVGPSGTATQTFASVPAATDWSWTAAYTGAAADVSDLAGLDAAVQASVKASDFTTAMATEGNNPPAPHSKWYINTVNNYVYNKVSDGQKFSPLMAFLVNNTGKRVGTLTVNYDFGKTGGGTEALDGIVVYYSFTGQVGSWTRVANLTATGTGLTLPMNFVTPWSDMSNLYLIFVDDNRNAGSGSEPVWSLDNVSFTPSALTDSPIKKVAYNDCAPVGSPGNPANTTLYAANNSGPLKDFATGEVMPITVQVVSTANNGTISGDTLAGDAASLFSGKVAFNAAENVMIYAAAGWYVDLIFTGLDPAKEYTIATFANRGGSTYTARLSKFTISGIDSAVNASSAGVTVNSPTSVTFCTGYNVNGYVARWNQIKCGDDGSFKVRVDDGGGDLKGYGPTAFMLIEEGVVDQSTAVSLSTPFNNQTFALGAPVPLTATAGSAVTNVSFYADGTLLGSSATAPYTYTWSNAGEGSHALTAVGSLDTGLFTTSSVVNIRMGIQAPYVIHISVDGLRSDVITILGQANLPNFYRFRTEGSFTDNARNDYDYSITLPNHTTQLTGRGVAGPTGHNWTSNGDPAVGQTLASNKGSYVAGAFDVAHDNGLRTAEYASKTKFSLHATSWNASNGALDTTGADNGRNKIDTYVYNGDTAALVNTMVANLASQPSHYTFLHLADPDSTGHGSGWDVTPGSAYCNTVKLMDARLGVIFNLITNNAELRGRTAIVLSADHGGFGNDHSNLSIPQDYTIPFYVWGPGVPAGKELYSINPATRKDPGTIRPPYTDAIQPIRNGECANVSLQLLGLGPVPGSTINFAQDIILNATPIKAKLTGPLDNATVGSGLAIVMTATVIDETYTNVDFYADGVLVGSSSTAPFTFSWTGASVGNHALTIVATDNTGNSVTSSVVNITVGLQTIAFAAPANHDIGESFNLVASASSGLPVSFSITGPATLSGNTVTCTGVGTVTVTASQEGNANFQAATPVTRTFTVQKFITCDWNDNTMQGWTNRKVSTAANGYLDLAFGPAQLAGTTYHGTSSQDPAFVPLWSTIGTAGSQAPPGVGAYFLGQIPMTNYTVTTDWGAWPAPGCGAHQTLWIQSPPFTLNGSGDLTYVGSGSSQGVFLTNVSAIPQIAGTWEADSTKGSCLIGLVRDDGVFVLSKEFSGGGGSWGSYVITSSELSTFVNDGHTYTLNMLDFWSGRNSWCAIDNVRIPGTLAVTKPQLQIALSSDKTKLVLTWNPTVGGQPESATSTIFSSDDITKPLNAWTAVTSTATLNGSTSVEVALPATQTFFRVSLHP